METFIPTFFPVKKPSSFLVSVLMCALIASSTTPALAEATPSSTITSAEHCPPFAESTLFREPVKTTTANPSNWITRIENAAEGEEILLEDGIYPLEQYAVVLNQSMTLRGASGNNEKVVIEGRGYDENAEALMIMANNVHIADLTVKNIRDHGITIHEDFAEPVIYNVNLVDIGTQHIKGNRPGPGGIIACSQLGYTTPNSTGDYNSAIDIHRAIEWTIRDNTIYNIYGDGSGCIVDADCGSMWPGGEPAILLWREAKDNTITRNTIVDSFRAIALGLDTPYSGGVVEDNFICRSEEGKDGINGFIQGDAGISLSGASNVIVRGNRIALGGDYPGQIEISGGTGITLENNTMSKPVWDRGNVEYEESGNNIDANFSVASCTEPDAILVATVTEENNQDNSATAMLTAEPIASLEVMPPPSADSDLADSHTTENENSLTHKALLLEIKEERLLAMEERLLATEERLKAKEERLLFLEQKYLLEEKIIRLEQLLRESEQQFNNHKQQLEQSK